MVTKKHVEAHWSQEEQMRFRQYAYPLGGDAYAFWDAEPGEWAPQNHSCDANTRMAGLNMIATREIATGEELTLDYGLFLDKEMEPFQCQCGSAQCRGIIKGI